MSARQPRNFSTATLSEATAAAAEQARADAERARTIDQELGDLRGDRERLEKKRAACLAVGNGHLEHAWTHEFPGMGVLAMEPLRSISTGNELAQGYNSEIAALTIEIDKREAEIEALLK